MTPNPPSTPRPHIPVRRFPSVRPIRAKLLEVGVRQALRLLAAAAVVLMCLESRPAVGQTTQGDLDQAAYQRCRQAEAEMERVVESLLAKAKGRPEAAARLAKAQHAWIAYRDAQLLVEWPSSPSATGSVLPMCQATERERLTRSRTADLRTLLERSEGEVCWGRWLE